SASQPVLHFVVARIRLCPCNANGGDNLRLGQFDRDPLRMHAVFFAGEWFRQIRIALPVGVEVSVIQPRIAIELRPAVAGYTPMRQGVSVGMTDRFLCRPRVTDEISVPGRIAPPPLRIPMPGLNEEFRILAIG